MEHPTRTDASSGHGGRRNRRPAVHPGRRRLLAAAGAAGLLAAVPLGTASAGTHPRAAKVAVKTATRGKLGVILVTSGGASLYRYTPDKPDTPTCTGACASLWPPYLLAAGASGSHPGGRISGLGTVKVAGGRLQVTFHKEPLYRYAPDHGTSTSGQGIGGVWFVLHPARTRTAAVAVTPTTAHGGYGGY